MDKTAPRPGDLCKHLDSRWVDEYELVCMGCGSVLRSDFNTDIEWRPKNTSLYIPDEYLFKQLKRLYSSNIHDALKGKLWGIIRDVDWSKEVTWIDIKKSMADHGVQKHILSMPAALGLKVKKLVKVKLRVLEKGVSEVKMVDIRTIERMFRDRYRKWHKKRPPIAYVMFKIHQYADEYNGGTPSLIPLTSTESNLKTLDNLWDHIHYELGVEKEFEPTVLPKLNRFSLLRHFYPAHYERKRQEAEQKAKDDQAAKN